jgi:hypothetical protein
MCACMKSRLTSRAPCRWQCVFIKPYDETQPALFSQPALFETQTAFRFLDSHVHIISETEWAQ